MHQIGFRQACAFVLVLASFCSAHLLSAQSASGTQSWSATSRQGSPDGDLNPTRTNENHSQSDGRVLDKTSIENMGPDGRYIPYSDTEKESVRINETTVRNIERTYGRDSDGHRTLIQERQEETRNLPGGEQTVTRTVANPDSNGGMQVVQREVEDSKQISPGVRVTNSTLMTPDAEGKFSASMRSEQRETRSSDGTIQSTKSTLLNDGVSGWKLSEVRDSTSKPQGTDSRSKEVQVLRPDSEGKLAVVERTVSKESAGNSGDRRATVETYSTNVPGVAGNNGLQLVQRETTVQRTASAGARSTTREIEQTRPGSSSGDMQVTQEAIDIIRPNASGTVDETRTILTPNSDGRLGQVWVDTGTNGNPAAIQVDTKSAPQKSESQKPAPK